jgi:aspartyl protease family protein
LQSISIGPIRVEGVDALVSKPGALRENLLGMSFLSRLRSYEFSGEFLTLRS